MSDTDDRGKAQARRLENAVDQLSALVDRPRATGEGLRAAPAEGEWAVMQVLGHVLEMLPYWMNHVQRLVEAAGEPPRFGRTLEDPDRLAGVERGLSTDPAELMGQIQREARSAAATMQRLTPEQRSKIGIHPRRGEMTVDEVLERFVVAHLEEHVEQVRATLT